MREENAFQGGAMTAAEDLQSAGTGLAENYREKAGQVWVNAKARVQTWQEDGHEFMRENPVKMMLTALSIGLVLGLTIGR